MHLRFSDRELATVLAALRYWQQALIETGHPLVAEHFEADDDVLTAQEIDGLCERINTGERSKP